MVKGSWYSVLETPHTFIFSVPFCGNLRYGYYFGDFHKMLPRDLPKIRSGAISQTLLKKISCSKVNNQQQQQQQIVALLVHKFCAKICKL